MSIAVVTGTSTGIGLATAVALARAGHQVFAGMRNTAKAEALEKAAAGLPVTVVECDVTSDASVAKAFARVAEAGPVDVLVNNAGIGGATPFELTPLEEHRIMLDTNYLGAVRCMQQVLPSMRERGAGCIVNISSIAGFLAIPNQSPYSASKFALEAMSEALAHEVWRFGVRVVLIEPGVIMTNIFENAAEKTRYDKHSPYQPVMRRNGKMYAAGFQRGTPPEKVAETILEAIRSDTYRLRWPVGEDAAGLARGRAKISDEQWVALGADLSDEEYNGFFREHFDIEL